MQINSDDRPIWDQKTIRRLTRDERTAKVIDTVEFRKDTNGVFNSFGHSPGCAGYHKRSTVNILLQANTRR